MAWNNSTGQRTLNLYVPVGRGTDRTVGLRPIVLRAGRNIADAPRKWSIRNSATAMLGIGSEGYYADTYSLDAQTRRGRRIEDTTSSQNLATSDAVLSYAQRRLSTKKDGTLEVTHGLSLLPGEPRPLVSFDVGDWVYSQTGSTLDRYRVVSWSLTVDAGQQTSATVTLNDAFTNAVTRAQQDLDSLATGETVVGTSQPTEDVGVPSTPAGLVVGSAAFMAGPDARASVTAGWSAVTTNTDGGAATDIAGYRVEWRPVTTTGWQFGADAGPQATSGQFTTGPAELIRVRVQAYDRNGNRSAWSGEVEHLTDNDTTPPGVPSTPVGGDYLGTVTVKWDGLTNSGADMQAAYADFSHVELHMSTTSGFTPSTSTRIGELVGRGTFTYADLPYGTTQYFKLISVDQRGNKSAASAQASGIPSPVVSADVFDGAIGTAKLADAAIVTAKIDNLAVNDAKIGTVGIGKLVAGSLTASMILSTGQISTRIGGTGAGTTSDSAGIRLYDTVGNVVVNLDVATASALVTGVLQTGRTGQRIRISGTDNAISFYPSNNETRIGKLYSFIPGNYPSDVAIELRAS